MLRLARATWDELEDVYRGAGDGASGLDDAVYPPGCVPGGGFVRLEAQADGGLIVRVERSTLAAGDFRLTCLFELGSCVFGSLDDFRSFCVGPLAVAFGVARAEAAACDARGGADGEVETASVDPSQLPLVGALVEEARAARSRRRLTAASLAERLGEEVVGQEAALDRVAVAIAGQLAKRAPLHPQSILLLGPTGVGKSLTIEALPRALRSLGEPNARLHRIDCNELRDDIRLTRVMGVGPGYRGHSESTELIDALREPGTIVMFDEIEKAHYDLFDGLLTLLDTGTLTAPSGTRVSCPHAVIAFTSNLGWKRLRSRLDGISLWDHPTVGRICRKHLVDRGFRPELVARIGSVAVYAELEAGDRHEAAVRAVRELGREYELELDEIDPAVLAVIVDLAEGWGAGARGVRHAAAALLSECFADVTDTGSTCWSVVAGPPPVLVRSAGRVGGTQAA